MSEFDLEVIKRIISLSFSKSNIDHWESFLIENENDFKSDESEYSHSQYLIYQDFIKIIEESLQKECDEYGIELDTFFEVCRIHDDLPAVNVFNTIITISTSPEMFFEVMRDIPKRVYMFSVVQSWRQYFAAA